MNNIEKASADDVSRLAPMIKNLCGFYGKHEADVMVAQTIHAAAINLEEHGEPFSFRGDGVFKSSGAGLVNNGSAYHRLMNDGMFIEEKRGEKVVIFPTVALVARLDSFFKKKEDADEKVA